MDTVKAAQAPYNFIPFSKKMPICRYSSIQELPAHNQIDPSLHTGQIQITLTAQTPVYIGNGTEQFFTTGDGRYAIPGSTLRGMVRQNMQILGLGVVHPGIDLEDRRIFYRKITAQKKASERNHNLTVKDPLVQYYQSALKVVSENRTTRPMNVRAGFLCHDAQGYHIEPTPDGAYIRLSRAEAAAQLQLRERPNACSFPVAYQYNGNHLLEMKRSDQPIPGWSYGAVLFTGKNVGPQPNHCYLFPQSDGTEPSLPLSAEDVLSYQLDHKDRQNSLKAYYDPQFWAMPELGVRKPVFYASIEGHLYWGMSLFLRIGYLHAIADGLPLAQKEAALKDGCYLDYPNSIMGFISRSGSYRSRLSFEDCPLRGAPHHTQPVKAILAGPKPSYYPGYVQEGKHYNEEDFQLRGYKFYWLKEFQKLDSIGKERVASTLHPLAPGAEFQGTIHFRNLSDDELGLLLWCLRLDEGCFQSLGMGKPLGMGRMTVAIDRLCFFDPQTLYSDFSCHADECSSSDISHYIDAYDSFACGLCHIKKPRKKPSLRSLEEIQDFFFAHSHLMDPKQARYMDLAEYRNVKLSLPSTADFRRADAVAKEPLPPPPADETPWAAMLRDKFNGNQNFSAASSKHKKKK